MNTSSALVGYRNRFVPLRQKPDADDDLDSQRVQMVVGRWKPQDQAYLGFGKTVEEHIRMLSGRQWDVWSDIYGRFIDVLQFMTEDERKHRMRPVMDYLGYWYLLTLSKATENQPMISFMPATSDRLDAMLAEVMDPAWKTLFDQMDMDSQVVRAVGWQLVAGEVHFLTRPDFSKGDKRQLIGPAVLSLDRGDGQPPIERVASGVPFDKDGNPQAKLVPDPDNPDDPEAFGYDVTGEPYEDLEGEPKVDVLCPLQVRAQWGQQISWRDKRWIAHEWFLLPEQIKEQFGADVEPDHRASTDEQGPGYLDRMLFGTGYFGASRGDPTAQTTSTEAKINEGYVRGISLWEKPIPGFTAETDDSPGGRFIVVAPEANKVLWDSPRPFKTECAGPIRRATFIDIPGRPNGTTILERMVPLQKRLNRVEAHVAEHTNLCCDPILMVHEAADIDDDEFVARPGVIITHGYNGPGRPAEWLAPPPLSPDVWKHKADIREQMFVIGSMMGNQSNAPAKNASGSLVEELRFNADRPIAPLTRNLAIALGEVAEDVLAILPTIWTEEKVISYSGADNVVRTVTVLPEMFQGRLHVKPSIESAAAGAKERRQQQLMQLWQMGAFGDPIGDPKARQQLLELLNYPDMNRAARPGGVDRVMAEHNLGRLVRGEQASAIPLLEMYDYGVHLEVVESYMKAPEYLQQDPAIQTQFVLYRQSVMLAQETQHENMIERTMPLAAKQAAAQGLVAHVAKAAHPQQEPPAGAGGDQGAAKPPNTTHAA